TSDFLLGRWHENASLRGQVLRRLAHALGTPGNEGLLLGLPRVDRIPIIRQRVEHLVKVRDLKTANRLVRLGLNWGHDSTLRFLEGQVLYESGQVSEGIGYMSMALEVLRQEGTVSVQNLLILGDALLRHGGSEGQREGLNLIEDAAQVAGEITDSILDQFLRVSLDLLEFRAVSRIATKIKTPPGVQRLARSLLPLLDHRDLLDQCGFEILGVIGSALKADSEDKALREAYKRVREIAEGKA
ncbi:MAG TPA: hypothetical protein VGM86_27890, partial [Thermoanaerobaculia bacterium]